MAATQDGQQHLHVEDLPTLWGVQFRLSLLNGRAMATISVISGNGRCPIPKIFRPKPTSNQ